MENFISEPYGTKITDGSRVLTYVDTDNPTLIFEDEDGNEVRMSESDLGEFSLVKR